jgi:hypothetical protein
MKERSKYFDRYDASAAVKPDVNGPSSLEFQ